MVQEKHPRAVRPKEPGAEPSPTGPQPDEDAARIAGYLSGQAQAFTEVDRWIRTEIQRRYPRLSSELEDLVQIVHAKLLPNLRRGTFAGRSRLRTYVTGIAHRTAIDRLREIYQQRALTPSALGEAVAPDNPYLPLEARDERRLLYQVLLSLPAGCRELWRLVFVDRLDYEEIGRRMAIPPGTVKSRMWHCRRKAMDALRRMRRIGTPGKKKRTDARARSTNQTRTFRGD